MEFLSLTTGNFWRVVNLNEVSLLYSPLVFKAVDLNSCVFKESFHVKEQCFVYDTFKRDKKEIFNLNPELGFEILEIAEDDDSRVFLKIKRNELLGYVPLDKVSNDWSVIKNKLDTFGDVNNIPAVCNDDRVKLRKELLLDCETLGYLNKGDKIFLKDHSIEE